MRNPKWANAEQSLIDVEVERGGAWVGLTLSATDEPTAALFADALAMGPAAHSEDIQVLRARASLTRQEFCIALKRAGILAGAEAIEAARGQWPAAFNAALPVLTAAEVDADEAQIIWAAAHIIERTHPMLAVLAQVAGLTDAQVDNLFGIGG